MTTKTKSRILEAVHESASDLHRLGFIDKRKMQKYDALCLEPVQDYDATKVKALCERLHLSQAALASVLNTSTSTVRKWGGGRQAPQRAIAETAGHPRAQGARSGSLIRLLPLTPAALLFK